MENVNEKLTTLLNQQRRTERSFSVRITRLKRRRKEMAGMGRTRANKATGLCHSGGSGGGRRRRRRPLSPLRSKGNGQTVFGWEICFAFIKKVFFMDF